MNKPALIATRYSDHKQDGSTSTEVQVDTCSSYCKKQKFKIIGHHKVEAESAKASNTSRIIELLDFCKQHEGKAKYLIVFKVNRFARDVTSHYFLKSQLLKIGIVLRSATEPIDESPTGELMETVLAGLAQFQNSVKREHVTLSMRKLLERGIWAWKTPLGYRNILNKLNKAGIPQIDDNCSSVIVEIFDRFATSTISEAELSKDLSKRTILDYKDRQIKFSPQLISKILNNKFYIGIMHVRKWNEEFDGVYDRLIDPAIFYKCQKILNPENKLSTRHLSINPDFPLKDKLLCDYCEKGMTAAWCTGKTKKYPLYYCSNSKCTNPGKKSVHKNDFEADFYEFLELVKPKEKHFKKFRDVLVKRYQDRQIEFVTKSDTLRKRVDVYETEKQRLIDMGKKGILDSDDLKTEIVKVKNQIMKAKLEMNESHEQEFKIELLLDYAESFFRTLPQFWIDASTSVKVQLQRILFPEGIVYSYSGFSNSKLDRRFALIEQVATSQSTLVTPRGFEPRLLG